MKNNQRQGLNLWSNLCSNPRGNPALPQTKRGAIRFGQLSLSLLVGGGLSLVGNGAIAAPAPSTAMLLAQSEPASDTESASETQLLDIEPTLGNEPATEAAEREALPSEANTGKVIDGDSEAHLPSRKGDIYSPIRLKSGLSIQDKLTIQDIPMGQGSFARDYVVTLKAEDQVAIDLASDSFDTVVTLMAENGTTLGENDDGPDGGTNSLLFMRITKDGDYVVRVRGFGQAKGGPFQLKLTRLEAAE